MKTYRVFVYGSLLSGLHNHRLLEGARFLGEARTRPLYTMTNLGAYPSVAHGGKTSILGEVWEVSAGQRARLDRLEGHPRFYTRSYVHLVGEPHRRHWVEAYFLDEPQHRSHREVRSGDWRQEVKASRDALARPLFQPGYFTSKEDTPRPRLHSQG